MTLPRLAGAYRSRCHARLLVARRAMMTSSIRVSLGTAARFICSARQAANAAAMTASFMSLRTLAVRSRRVPATGTPCVARYMDGAQ